METDIGKGEDNRNRPPGVDICYCEINLEKQAHKLAKMM